MTTKLEQIHNCEAFIHFLEEIQPQDSTSAQLAECTLFKGLNDDLYTGNNLRAKFDELYQIEQHNPTLCRKMLEVTASRLGWSFEQILDSWCKIEEKSGNSKEHTRAAREALLAFIEEEEGSSISLRGLSLRTCPPFFAHPAFNRLKQLDLSFNQLTQLPEECAHLSNLELLHLSYNALTSLPKELESLPLLTHLYVDHNPFSGGKEAGGAMVNPSSSSIQDSLVKLEALTGKPLPNLIALSEDPQLSKDLALYIDRIHSIYTDHDDLAFAQTVAKVFVTLLEAAIEDPAYRIIFARLLKDAVGLCGDRVLFALVEMEIAKNQNDPVTTLKQLANHLMIQQTVAFIKQEGLEYAMKIHETAQALHYGLYILIRLKERLKLPVHFNRTLFPRVGTITDNDLRAIEGRLRKARRPELFAIYLATNESWITAISKDPRYQSLVHEKDRALEDLQDKLESADPLSQEKIDAAYAEIRLDFEAKIAALTTQILNE